MLEASLQAIEYTLSSICHCLPRGHARVAKHPLVTRLFRHSKRELTARLKNGVRLPVDVTDYDGRMLFLFGSANPNITNACRALLRPGDCFLDVGANCGGVGFLCHDVVGPTGEIHLFEPQPELCDRMQRSLRENGLSNIHVHEIGLLDRDEQLSLARTPSHSGMASFVRNVPGNDAIIVPVRDASEYVPNIVGQRTVGAKLDIEGAEHLVLPALLRLPGLCFVVLECRDAIVRRGVWDSVRASGMVLYGFPQKSQPRNRLVLTPIRSLEQMVEHGDFLLVPPNPKLLPESAADLETLREAKG